MVAMGFLSLVGNSFGCSASGERLVSAARDGDVQEAKALLEYNPRLARYSTFGVRNSPLHYSAAQGHHEIVSLLLESGVDINLRNYRGQTALMQALYPSLRVAYIDEVEEPSKDMTKKVNDKVYYSTLVKAALPKSNSSDPGQNIVTRFAIRSGTETRNGNGIHYNGRIGYEGGRFIP
ncbi:hypothetical protein OROMI_024164 [Orobanche minor]